MKEKLTKEGVYIIMYIIFLCILGMTSAIKFETICVFLMVIEKFSQLNYLYTKSVKSIVSCCYKPPYGNWKNHCDHLQKILMSQCKTNFTLLQEILT